MGTELNLEKPRARMQNKPPKQRKKFVGNITRVTIAMEEDIWKRLKILSIIENRTFESVVDEALENFATEAEREHAAEVEAARLIKSRAKKKKT